MFEDLRSRWSSIWSAKRRNRRRTPCLEPLEDRWVPSTTIAEFPVGTPLSSPDGLVAGSDGNLWFTENQAGKIGMINPTTHVVTESALPIAASGPMGITAGPNGNLWFTEFGANKIGEINPSTHAIVEFAIPTPNSGATDIAVGPDGALWFTEYNASGIGRIDPNTGLIFSFATASAGAEPYGITSGANGNLWFTEFGAGKIGAINAATHIVADIATPTSGSGPMGITTGPDGNLWFTELNAGRIGIISPTNGAIAEIPTPTPNSAPLGITTGPDGNLWFVEKAANQVGELTLSSHVITETAVPTVGSFPTGIAAGPGGSLWYSESVGNQIGEIFTPPIVTASPASASIVENQTATFSAASSSMPAATVQWQVSIDGGSTFVPLTNGGDYSGVTATTLTVTGALANMSGYEYEAVFSGGGTSVTTSPATLTITPVLSIAPLSQGVVGTSYSQTDSVVGSTTGFTLFAVSNFSAGTTGLTLASISTNPVGGTVSVNGTPTGVGTASFTLTVANSAGNTLTQTLTITINPPLSIATPSLPPATAGSSYSQTISVVGGVMPYSTFSVTNFSAGATGMTAVQIIASAGTGTFTVSGTPTAAGTVSFTVNVTDSAGTTRSKNYTILVNPALVITPSLAQGTAGVNYHQTLTVSGGVVPYPTIAISNFSAGGTGLALGNIAIDTIVGTITVNGTPTAAGTLSFAVNVVDAAGAVLNKTYTITINPPLTITSSLPAGTAGAAYAQTIAVSGGTTPYTTFTVTGFSAGTTGLTAAAVTADPVSGKFVVSGTPTASGTVTFVANVADTAGGVLNKTFTVTINAAPTIGDLTVTQWTAGAAGFNGTMTISDGTPPHGVFTATGLPIGLTAVVNGNTISFTGTPIKQGTYASASITIHDAAGASVTKSFSITINAGMSVGTLSASQWTAGSSGYTGTMPVSGGTGALSVAAVSGLPTGLSLVLSGSTIGFTGTPTTAATYAASVTLRDSLGATFTKTFSITVNPPPTVANPTTTQWTAGAAGFASALTVSGGTGPFAIVSSSGLPTGVTATVSGNTIRLSGTPTTAQTFSSSITIVDATGASVTRTFSITINPPVAIVTAAVPASKMALNYSDTLQAAGGTGGVQFTLVAGSLPPGMRISSAGVISGVSRGFGAFTFTIAATDAVGATVLEKYTLVLSFR